MISLDRRGASTGHDETPLNRARRPELPPPRKWGGGKRWLIPNLMRYWKRHAHRRLVEPFAGGLAVALALRPERALLNDVNPHLVAFYEHLQRGLVIDTTRVVLANNRSVYMENRTRFNELIAAGKSHSPEASMLFYFLNRTGYNGLCRFSQRGFFNVPFGRHKTVPYKADLSEYVHGLEGWQFTCGDFTAIDLNEDDFVYADPPYDVEFTSYSAGGFTWPDQERLAEYLANHRGPVIASNQATPRIKRLYRKLGFKVKEIAAPRRISCNGDRTDAVEMFATKGV
jgi:DNA adenine methylase